MPPDTPRLRLFAGPNGSGKSTLKNVLNQELLGTFINADELEANANAQGYLSFSELPVDISLQALIEYCNQHNILKKHGLESDLAKLKQQDATLILGNLTLTSYHSSAICNFIRDTFLQARKSFSFETVMSHESKVELLQQAQALGYRTYLYFVATESPEINIARVKERKEAGGHDVPEDKIRSRYARSLNLLYDAITYSNRAYLFDNSHDDITQEPTWVAEVNEETIVAKTHDIPHWLAATWEKF